MRIKSIKSPTERLLHFGQADHVRIYSVLGLARRLEKAGFHVTPIQYTVPERKELQLKTEEYILLAQR